MKSHFSELTLPALIGKNIARHNSLPAVKNGDAQVTYQQLDIRSEGLANEIMSRGIKHGDGVVLMAQRGINCVVGCLAILKTGGYVIPVDNDTPEERVAFILGDVEAKMVLCDKTAIPTLKAINQAGFLLLDQEYLHTGENPKLPVIAPADLAYVIYTSGTTGQPKGVMIDHQNISTRFYDWQEIFELSSSTRVLQVAKLGFDLFIGDFVKALCSGGCLVICSLETQLMPDLLYKKIKSENITYVDLVPAVVRHLSDYVEEHHLDLSEMDVLNCGADIWTKEEYIKFKKTLKVKRLVNGYGITECSVESTVFEDDDGTIIAMKETLPIGYPLNSDSILIVNEKLDPLSSGEVGEICIGGPCISRGYINRADLNQKSFFFHTNNHGVKERFYKSGDMGSMDSQGMIDFYGRLDNQIKLNGYRIELHEIERTIEREPAIQKAVAGVVQGQEKLTVFYQLKTEVTQNVAQVIQNLNKVLPAYMIPSKFSEVTKIPLTTNGKIDRSIMFKQPNQKKSRNKKKPHNLHQSTNLTTFKQLLAEQNIDLMSLVYEFIKPNAKIGVMVVGSIADKMATEISDLDLLVLVSDKMVFKKQKREISGAVVNYLATPEKNRVSICVFINGIEMNFDFMIQDTTNGTEVDRQNDVDVVDSKAKSKLLCRLSGHWVLHGQETVEQWRKYYQVDKFKLKLVTVGFTTAAKNLEDMESGIGLEKAHVGILGTYIVNHLLRVMLAFVGEYSCNYSSKWMRKVGQVINESKTSNIDTFKKGRALMFPALHQNEFEEKQYFEEVYAFCQHVRGVLSEDEGLKEAFNTIVYDLDIIL